MKKNIIMKNKGIMFFGLVILLFITSCMLIMPSLLKANADDSLNYQKPGEFGNLIGDAIDCVYNGEALKAQNCERGYFISKTDDYNADTKQLKGEKLNVVFAEANHNVVVDSTKVEKYNKIVVDYDVILQDENIIVNKKEVNNFFPIITGEKTSSHIADKIKDEYASIYTKFISTGENNPGLRNGDMGIWDDAVVKQEYWYSDSTYTSGTEKIGWSAIMYNSKLDKALYIADEYFMGWEKGDNNTNSKKLLHAPVWYADTYLNLKAEYSFVNILFNDSDLIMIFDGGIVQKTGEGTFSIIYGSYDYQIKTFTKFTDASIDTSAHRSFGLVKNVEKIAFSQGNKKHVFVNYTYGAVYYIENGAEKTAHQYIGGRNFTTIVGTLSDEALSLDSLKSNASIVCDISRLIAGLHQDEKANVVTLLSNNNSTYTYDTLSQKFKEFYDNSVGKYNSINLGIPGTGLKSWDGNICQEWEYGDSTKDDNRKILLVYSFSEDKVYYMNDKFVEKFRDNYDVRKTMGNLKNNSNEDIIINGETRKIQYSDSAYFELSNNSITFTSGKTYNPITQKIEDILTYDSSFGVKISSFNNNGKTYVNFLKGYAIHTIDNIDDIKYVANFNINNELEISAVSETVIKNEINARGVETSGDDSVYKVLDESQVSQAYLIEEFSNAVIRAVQKGYSVGITNSKIKIWGSNILMDFSKGDGEFAFGGDRVNMSFVVFNKVTKTAHVVGDYSKAWAQDNTGAKLTIGDPLTDTFNNLNVQTPNGEKNYIKIQFFDFGIIYTNESGTAVVDAGLMYEFKDGKHILSEGPAPTKPDVYKTLLESTVDGNTYYFNYEYGAIKAEKTNFGYKYTYYNCRYFDFSNNYSIKKYPVDYIVDWDNVKFETNNSGKSNVEILSMLKQVYEYYYSRDFIIGRIDGEIRDWNGAYTMQCVFGDSNAQPFEEGRKDFSALMFSADYSQVFLVCDGAIELYDEHGAEMGLPTEERFYDASIDKYIQHFEKNCFVVMAEKTSYIVKRQEYSEFVDEYLEFYNNFKPSHDNKENQGFVDIGSSVNPEDLGLDKAIASGGESESTDTGCSGVIIGTPISIAIFAVVALSFVILIKRKSNKLKQGDK